MTEVPDVEVSSLPTLAKGMKRQLRIAEKIKHIIVVDGCKSSCAKNLADYLGLPYEAYLNLNELGIKKLTPFSSNRYSEKDVRFVKKILREIIMAMVGV